MNLPAATSCDPLEFGGANRAEADFLLACVRHYCGSTLVELNPVNGSKLLELAQFNGILPILHHSLTPSLTIPADIVDRLSEASRANSYLNLLRTQELFRILTHLKAQGIAAIPFKGVVLAEMAHGSIAMRQFGDLDLLVHPRDFWQAKAVLVAQGYCTEATVTQEAAGFHRYCQISLFHPTRSSSLDLHWGIPPRRFWRGDRLEVPWQNLQVRSIAGQTIQTFSIEMTLVIQAVNAVKEPQRRSALKQVCDLAKLIQLDSTLDWELVWQIAGRLRVRKLVLIGLSVVHQLLQVSLPVEILAIIAETKGVEAIAVSVSQQVLAKIDLPSQGDDRLESEYGYQLKTSDRTWHQGVILLQELRTRLILIATHFIPNERDRQTVALPGALSFLYYFLKILRVIDRSMSKAMSKAIAPSAEEGVAKRPERIPE